jgi:hypothetical protein
MKPVSEALREQGFILDAALHHQELIPFVIKHLFIKNKVTIPYFILTLLFFIYWAGLDIYSVYTGKLTLTAVITASASGIVVSLLLAPLHELLHGAAYRVCGARSVTYKANWKKYYIMAIADQFVAGRKPFYFIGSSPFVIISVGLTVLISISNPWLQVMWLTTLWTHATMCAGDFGLMSYFAEHRDKEVVTFDDAKNSVSYFYSRKV